MTSHWGRLGLEGQEGCCEDNTEGVELVETVKLRQAKPWGGDEDDKRKKTHKTTIYLTPNMHRTTYAEDLMSSVKHMKQTPQFHK